MCQLSTTSLRLITIGHLTNRAEGTNIDSHTASNTASNFKSQFKINIELSYSYSNDSNGICFNALMQKYITVQYALPQAPAVYSDNILIFN